MDIKEIRNYCLNCINKPCSNKGCPLNNNIPDFIHEENIEKAYNILSQTTVLPAICGAICPHKKQCEGSCIRGIKGESVEIGKIEKFIGKKSIEKGFKIPTDIDKNLSKKKVAIIGGGPAGLTCAAFLARKGIKVTIYEKHTKLGGILSYGIPDFRLDTNVVKDTIQKILDLGITVKLNKKLGKDIFIKDLQKKYDAIFIGIGANISNKMGIEGEDLNGVMGGCNLLESKKHPNYEGKKVAVIGGGNVAMDVARTIKRLDAKEVTIIYRRSKDEMPADIKEIEDAKKDGVNFLYLTNIVKIFEKDVKGKVGEIECIKTKLIKKEGDTRLSPVNVENSNFKMNMDYVVMATGSKPDDKVIMDFNKNKRGYIDVNSKMETSIDKVFAGGDIVGEKATVAYAARSGRNAAENIINFLK